MLLELLSLASAGIQDAASGYLLHGFFLGIALALRVSIIFSMMYITATLLQLALEKSAKTALQD